MPSYYDIVNYEYTSVPEGTSQYADVNLAVTHGVEAKYVEVPAHRGNMYIEALPKPCSGEALRLKCSVPLAGYSTREKEIEKSTLDQVLTIRKIKDVRFQLPMNSKLESRFYEILCDVYSRRKPFYVKDVFIPYTSLNVENETNMKNVTDVSNDPPRGFSLIGYSSCGKSSALKTLLKNFPQYIIHKGSGITSYPQIPYLIIQCPANSNFKGLYHNIGRAIDRALGNLKPFYAEEFREHTGVTLAEYKRRAEELIERFAIGIIIIDEIQHMDMDMKNKNSLEALLELNNSTGVAFGVVGTEEAKLKLFSSTMRLNVRLGADIPGDDYCASRTHFDGYVTRLLSYQWFDTDVREETTKNSDGEEVYVFDEICDALYECSGGIIGILSLLYIYMNIDYVRSTAGKRPKVNAKYVYKIANRYFSGLVKLMQKVKANDMLISAKVREIDANLERIIEEETNKAALKATAEQLTHGTTKADEARKSIIEAVFLVTDKFPEDEVVNAANSVLSSASGLALLAGNRIQNLTRMTFKLLEERNTPKAKKEREEKRSEEAKSALAAFIHEAEGNLDEISTYKPD